MEKMGNHVPAMLFDDRNIRWKSLGEAFPHFEAAVFEVDEQRRTVEFIVKFEPNQKIVYHRHLAPTRTFVVQGEHRLYEVDGSLKEARKVGTYTFTPTGAAPHLEGGGAEGCIVYYSMRAAGDEELFEVLDEQDRVLSVLGFKDFAALKD
jgi:2,4'-dihydroxyacetophenone dioxygenase